MKCLLFSAVSFRIEHLQFHSKLLLFFGSHQMNGDLKNQLASIGDLFPPLIHIDLVRVVEEVENVHGINFLSITEQLSLCVNSCEQLSTLHVEYHVLALRLKVFEHHQNTKSCSRFVDVAYAMYNMFNSVTGEHVPRVSLEIVLFATQFAEEIENRIDYTRDYKLPSGYWYKQNSAFQGCRLTTRSTVQREFNPLDGGNKRVICSDRPGSPGFVAERDQHVVMRVAISLFGFDPERVFRVYDELSAGTIYLSTMTMQSAGTDVPQLASSFVLGSMPDQTEGVFSTLGKCAAMNTRHSSRFAFDLHDIRPTERRINKNAGGMVASKGIVPLMHFIGDAVQFLNADRGRRNDEYDDDNDDEQGGEKSTVTVYMEPWHMDIERFLTTECPVDMKRALWIPNLFMQRVAQNGDWTLMDSSVNRGLSEYHGQEFEKRYLAYESRAQGTRTMSAKSLWKEVLRCQKETGMPFLCYKDACNAKSNQKHLGTIRSANDSTEAVLYTSSAETATCFHATLHLPSFLVLPSAVVKHIQSVPRASARSECQSPRHRLLTTAALFVVDTRFDCVYGKLAIALIRRRIRGALNVKDILGEETFLHVREITGESTTASSVPFPRIFFHGEYIGGYTELSLLLRMEINHAALVSATESVTTYLNRVLDTTDYPDQSAKDNALLHRPLAIGVHGLSEVFLAMRIPFDSTEARRVNAHIFESIYYGAMKQSCALARRRTDLVQEFESFLAGSLFLKVRSLAKSRRKFDVETWKSILGETSSRSDCLSPKDEQRVWQFLDEIQWSATLDWTQCSGQYSSFQGSPLSHGKFQFDLWDDNPPCEDSVFSGRYDWEALRAEIKKHGIRNCMVCGGSSSNGCEPIDTNTFLSSKENIVTINDHLRQDLEDLEMWTENTVNVVMACHGSVQSLPLPPELKRVYLTALEISSQIIVDMAADRGRFLCQSQSTTVYMPMLDMDILSDIHFYGFRKGLKTGMRLVGFMAEK